MDEAEGGLRVGALSTDVCGLLAAARAAHLLGPGECRAEPIVLHRRAGLVVRVGGLVLKAHPEGTRRAQLRARLRAANTTGSFLTPLHTEPARLGGRLVSVWPYGLPVDPERPADAPFLDAAALLAGLHAQTPVVPGLPRHRAVQRVTGALTRARVLGAQALSAARRAVEGAAGTLPAWARDPDVAVPPGRPRRLVHGDWHLGQMVRPLGLTRPGGGGAEAGQYAAGQHAAGQHEAGQHEPRDSSPRPDLRLDGWRLIDIDDLGSGDPAWDLAWPASWFAVGLLGTPEWSGLLSGYVSAGGAALSAGEDVWTVLDPFARAATVHRAAVALVRADEDGRALDEAEEAFIDACARMAAHPDDRRLS